ncbi:hypothetical protein T4E_5573 [Trichinella pseudospiralis]|uniref:Uncharacterized protein n=1 Tax=Trichinella pseudospiralis TaxID=6337 RepID=A0A0V0Y9L0_TRIPS|nr:hypothetical protein T4E_5573 [Trichinella pseudospiralis]
MIAEDVFQVYDKADIWNSVFTVILINTFGNVIKCVERIFVILKPGCSGLILVKKLLSPLNCCMIFCMTNE